MTIDDLQRRIADLEIRVPRTGGDLVGLPNATIDLKNEHTQYRWQVHSLQSEIDALLNDNQRLKEVEAQNRQLEDQNRQLTEHIKKLEAALNAQADAKASKKPDFKLHYDVERNQPGPDNETQAQREAREAAKRQRPQAGRIPSELKTANVQRHINIYPDNYSRSMKRNCVVHREQRVWRLFEGEQACYVCYRIFALPGATELPCIV